MRLMLALLLSLVLPGCRGQGAEGVAPAALLDMAALQRPATPNTALAAPAGFSPAPDIITQPFAVAPERLFAALRAVALAQPRTTEQAVFADRRQAHFVARSRWFNFPDLIAAEVTADSALILWSRSVYGRSDFGANQARLSAWLAALEAAMAR